MSDHIAVLQVELAGSAESVLVGGLRLLPLVREAFQGVEEIRIVSRPDSATRLVFHRVTMQPGTDTGWHTHAGPVFAVVESGTLTHYLKSGRVETYTAGEVFEETPGVVHLGANHASEPVVLDVTYVLPSGAPLRDEAGRDLGQQRAHADRHSQR